MAGTETISPRYRGIDTWGDGEVLEAFWEGQARAIASVRPALPSIAAAARAISERLGTDGRIVYAGAGSSGRQAALDGMELGSTFGWPGERIAFVLAEGTQLDPAPRGTDEDDTGEARRQMAALAPAKSDVLIAVAASGTTPFTLVAAEAAKAAGALVVAIANNPGAPLFGHADHRILVESGGEVISGSTRMNAGTAQKAVLGLLSSLVMTRLGHVHDGLMVSMRVDCTKLEGRAARIVAALAECSEQAAEDALRISGQRIKPAILVAKGADLPQAEHILRKAGGNLRIALGLLAR